MGGDFRYAREFRALDYAALREDLAAADDRLAGLVACGLRARTAPLPIPAWRGARPARARTGDGRARGGAVDSACAPLGGWPDDVPAPSTGRAALRWPDSKLQKFGGKLSWARPPRSSAGSAPSRRSAPRRSASAAAAEGVWEPGQGVRGGAETAWLADAARGRPACSGARPLGARARCDSSASARKGPTAPRCPTSPAARAAPRDGRARSDERRGASSQHHRGRPALSARRTARAPRRRVGPRGPRAGEARSAGARWRGGRARARAWA